MSVSANRNIVANYASRIWSAIMGLAFIPAYARLMGIEAMGVVGLFVTLQAFCMLLDIGLSTTLNRELAKLSADESSGQEMRNLVRTFEALFWVASAVAGLAVMALAAPIAHHWVNSSSLSAAEVASAIRLMGLVLFAQLPLSLYLGGLLGLQRQVEYSALTAAWYTLRFGGAVFALALFGATLSTFFIWQVIVAGGATAASAVLLWKRLPPGRANLEWSLLRSRWRFAAGIGGISITLLVLNHIDKVVLSKLVSLEAFGYYTLAWSLANAVRLLGDPIFTTFFPQLSQAYATGIEREVGSIYHRICSLMTLLVVPFSVTLILFAPEALMVWTGSPAIADRSHTLLSLLAAGNLFLALAICPYALQLAGGWTSLTFWANVIASAVLIPLMVVLAPIYGTLGGGWAWLGLNAGYLLTTVAIMHRRLLVGHFRQWISKDIGVTFLLIFAVSAGLRTVLQSSENRSAALIVLALAFLAAQGAGLLTSPLTRGLRLKLWSRLAGAKPSLSQEGDA